MTDEKAPARRCAAQAKTVTLQDIATRCQVCKMTVSRALRHDPRISAATTERVLAAAAALGYDPSHQMAARRLALRKHGQDIINQVIALFLPPFFYKARYFSDIFHGLLDVLTAEGFSLLTHHVQDPPAGTPIPLPSIIGRGDVDGVLVLASPPALPSLQEALRQNVGFGSRPLVAMICPASDAPAVVTDDAQGAYEATRRLLELGHRQILHPYNLLGHFSYQRRYDGMRRAYAEYGLDIAECAHDFTLYLGPMAPGFHLETSEAFLENARNSRVRELVAYLRAHPAVTAIFAQNDATAIRVWYTLQRAGFHVPDEISVVGFDDTDPLPDAQGHNLLSSVRLPLVDVGREAARLIISRVTRQSTGNEQIVLPTAFIGRRSLAPATRR